MEPKDLKNSEELKFTSSEHAESVENLQSETAEVLEETVEVTTAETETMAESEFEAAVSVEEPVVAKKFEEAVVQPESAPEVPSPDEGIEESGYLAQIEVPEEVPEEVPIQKESPAVEADELSLETEGEAVEATLAEAEKATEAEVEVIEDSGHLVEAEVPAEVPVQEESPAVEVDELSLETEGEAVEATLAEAEKATEAEVEVKGAEDHEPAATEGSPEDADVKDSPDREPEVVTPEDQNVEDETPDDEASDEEPEEKQVVRHSTADYFNLTRVELVNLLREVVEESREGQGHNADAIVAVFYRKSREASDELKKKFVEEGGNPEDYTEEEDPYNNDVKDFLKKYRQQRFEQGKRLDADKDANLQLKYELIEEIKNLLNKEESINRTFQEFRDLQKKWYEIGQVPQAKMKDLWDTYHFHVENFYDYIKINKELRDLDLKKNLEVKIEICETAEELLVEPSVIKAFNALQKLHEEWREIGPVPSDKKDDIWERFKAATSIINLKHQDYFEKRKLDQKKNLDAKIALCEKAEEISAMVPEAHRDWDDKSRELVELQKVWKTIGFAPKRDNNRVYERFRAACDEFFVNKREYYSRNKDVQQENLQMKIDLCMEAENLRESTDWKKATQQFIDIQKRWKEIGPIPRKSSDAIWKRFRAACDFFFEKKADHFSDIDGEQAENLKLKEQLIEDVENFKPDSDPTDSLKVLRDFQRRWNEIGHVPIRSKDTIQRRFRDAINKQFDSMKVDGSNRNVFSFRNKIESLTDNARGLSKVRSEREKYMIKLKQLENDLTLLDNNIGFFANSKNAQILIADVNQKIVDTREKIEQLKEKIRIIDDLDKSEY